MSKLKNSNTVTNAATLNKPSVSSFKDSKNSTSSNMFSQSSAVTKQKDLAIQSQLTKKRSALGNISNGTGGGGSSTSTNLSSCNTGSNSSINSASSTKEVSKKSRFGVHDTNTATTNATATLPLTCGVQPVLKKSDSILANKKSSLLTKETVGSKENFSNSLLPSSLLGNKKKQNEQKNQQQPETKSGTTAKTTNAIATSNETNARQLMHSSTSINIKPEKSDINDIKQEAILKLEQIKTESGLSKPNTDNEMQECFEDEHHDHHDVKEEEKIQSTANWEDIDANDVDEFNANDYVNYIFKYYNEREDMFIINDYIKEQPHINKQMRLLLVDWMVEVQQQLEFNHEVLYLSVKLLDLYLNGRKVEKEKLQLLGGAAMFIACKFEERMPPIIDDFIYVSDNAYNRKELIKMEIDILKSVRFDIGIPLSYTFLRRYAKCVKADMRFLTLARYILELSLQEYSFVHQKDSLKACAALYLALKMTVCHENNLKTSIDKSSPSQLTVSSSNLSSTEWNSTLIHYTGFNINQFINLVPSMNNLIQTAPTSKYRTIYRKYSHPVFYEVAKVSPLTQVELDSLAENQSLKK